MKKNKIIAAVAVVVLIAVLYPALLDIDMENPMKTLGAFVAFVAAILTVIIVGSSSPSEDH